MADLCQSFPPFLWVRALPQARWDVPERYMCVFRLEWENGNQPTVEVHIIIGTGDHMSSSAIWEQLCKQWHE